MAVWTHHLRRCFCHGYQILAREEACRRVVASMHHRSPSSPEVSAPLPAVAPLRPTSRSRLRTNRYKSLWQATMKDPAIKFSQTINAHATFKHPPIRRYNLVHDTIRSRQTSSGISSISWVGFGFPVNITLWRSSIAKVAMVLARCMVGTKLRSFSDIFSMMMAGKKLDWREWGC
nr:hypothetical protein Itr_chr13CG06110 [Ipomoea trifida]